ncbi:MAG: hypothetical protein IKE74_08955 [Mogibacterium sp.]|nr:hypothetical protein [Mogibacterium sp.]
MTNEVLKLFEKISVAAMDRGLYLQLEQKEYFRDSKGIGPSIGGGHTEDTGVVLRVYQPDKDNEQEQEESDD